MAKITTAKQLAEKALDVAKNYKTLYVMGCLGAPLNAKNKEFYCNWTSYNKRADRQKMIKAATAKTFGFDCVCLIKSLLMGWTGDYNARYGGAVYGANGIPDITADAMFKACTDQSSDFSDLEVGEAVWTSGHIGIYVGNGLAVECTPSWKNGVQVTACNRSISGYNRRNWTKHGKLPYVKYETKTATATAKALTFKVGDIVQFTGSTHYTNANAATGPKCKPGKAQVVATYKSGKHPYSLKYVSGGDSTVYGWVDAEYVKECPEKETVSTKAEAAQHRDNSLSGTYKTTANLNMRTGAGTDKKVLTVIPKGKAVKCYGYYSTKNGAKWLYVVYNGVSGYCMKTYLTK